MDVIRRYLESEGPHFGIGAGESWARPQTAGRTHLRGKLCGFR
jgi:hypothetical protein